MHETIKSIKSCTCKHPFQDEKYGLGKRVHNKLTTVRDRPQEYKCTVCGKVRC